MDQIGIDAFTLDGLCAGKWVYYTSVKEKMGLSAGGGSCVGSLYALKYGISLFYYCFSGITVSLLFKIV